MDALDISFSIDTSGEKAKVLALVQLGLSLFFSDASDAVVAGLGVLGVVLPQREVLSLFVVLSPLSCLGDLAWLIGKGKIRFFSRAFLVLLLVILKLAGAFFALDHLRSTDAPGGPSAGVPYYSPEPQFSAQHYEPPQAPQQYEPTQAPRYPPARQESSVEEGPTFGQPADKHPGNGSQTGLL